MLPLIVEKWCHFTKTFPCFYVSRDPTQEWSYHAKEGSHFRFHKYTNYSESLHTSKGFIFVCSELYYHFQTSLSGKVFWIKLAGIMITNQKKAGRNNNQKRKTPRNDVVGLKLNNFSLTSTLLSHFVSSPKERKKRK